MNKNKVLNYIIESIQWGFFLEGSNFLSEKQLSIKFNVSHSTAKNALNNAETMGLLISEKGKNRKVLNFERNVSISSYLNANKSQIKVKTIKEKQFNKNDENYFKNNLKYKFILSYYINNNEAARLYSSSENDLIINSFSKNKKSFLLHLRDSKKIINLIEKIISVDKDGFIIINRKLWDSQDKIIEEAFIKIDPKFFIRKKYKKFYYY